VLALYLSATLNIAVNVLSVWLISESAYTYVNSGFIISANIVSLSVLFLSVVFLPATV